MMTRKDYIATANILKSYREDFISPATHEDMVRDIAVMMKADNPRFDFNRFLDASGVKPL